MILTIKKIVFLGLCLFFYAPMFAQGLQENELSGNSVLIHAYKQMQEKSLLRSGSINDTLSLGTRGFLDDFSKPGPYPDTAKWITNKVFVNNEYAKSPPTIGVATFDGLDSDGYPYDFTAPATSSGKADSLISKPIDLTYPASDSLYFSFFYQPQGIGNAPEQADSLIVLFKAPGPLSSWNRVWTKKGSTLAANDSSWKTVMIPITNAAYLQKGFQFCIMNYATRSGNVDHWNIDYVYLNRLRHKADTVFEDVSFTYDLTSLLNSYSQMPWRHYVAGESKSSVNTIIRNNHTTVKNVSFKHNFYDTSNTLIYNSSLSASNVDPVSTNGYFIYNAGSLPSLPPLTAPGDCTFEAIINSTPDFQRQNDTLRHIQQFRYHYAYDDGTAESAFGLSTLNSKLAEKFTSTVADTLRYIDIYFNPLMLNASVFTFRLKVWADVGGYPAAEIFSADTLYSPAYNHYGHNSFIRYPIEPPLYLGATTFHIGFQQNTNQFLNIGVDKNTNTQNNVSYNVSGSWLHSPYPGSLMVHPVFGSASDFAVSDDNLGFQTNTEFVLFPNPSNEFIQFASTKTLTEKLSVTFYDVSGRIVYQQNIQLYQQINVAELPEGIYFIQLQTPTQSTTLKFVKIK